VRELNTHRVEGSKTDKLVQVYALDKPGDGGASHVYDVEVRDWAGRETYGVTLRFQQGPVGDAGLNGITNEALLAVVEDRLVGFQSGLFACKENMGALKHVRTALMCLKERTEARMDRGVEGTHTP